jgi:hypothetical protein
VDDGTGCINCILEIDEPGDDQRQIDDDLKMMRAEAAAAPEDMLVQMALITVQSSKRLVQETCPDGLKPGDNVQSELEKSNQINWRGFRSRLLET